MYCVKCGNKNEDSACFCSMCGMPVFINLTAERLAALEMQKKSFENSKAKFCVRCGKAILPGARFCTGCGSEIESRTDETRCQSCGAVRIPGARFCSGCGSRLTEW